MIRHDHSIETSSLFYDFVSQNALFHTALISLNCVFMVLFDYCFSEVVDFALHGKILLNPIIYSRLINPKRGTQCYRTKLHIQKLN